MNIPDCESEALGGVDFDGQTPPEDKPDLSVGQRILRYNDRKSHQIKVTDFLANFGEKETSELAIKLHDCGNQLVFRDYYTVQDVRLIRACFCKKHTLCLLCAVRRQAKMTEKFLKQFQFLIDDYKKQGTQLYPHFIVLTIKNGPDLKERLHHLNSAWKKLLNRRRLKNRYKGSALEKINGGVISFEVTNIGNGWHPHINLLALSDQQSFNWQDWKDEWLEITGDSSNIHFSSGEQGLEKTIGEVIKYISKFSDLTGGQLWELHKAVTGRRMIRGFGDLRGLQPPEKLTDELLASDLPYIEYVCGFLGPEIGYSILQTFRSAIGAEAA